MNNRNVAIHPRILRRRNAINNHYRRELEYLAYFAVFAIGFRLWLYVIDSRDVTFEVLAAAGTMLIFFILYIRCRRQCGQQNAGDAGDGNQLPQRLITAPALAPVERMRALLRRSAQQGRIVEELVDLLPRRAYERLQRSNSQRDRANKVSIALGLGIMELNEEEIQLDIETGSSGEEAASLNKMSSDNNMLCSICLDEYVNGAIIVRLPCQHEYHENCVLQWMGHSDRQRNYCCPLCKQDVAMMLAFPMNIENALVEPTIPEAAPPNHNHASSPEEAQAAGPQQVRSEGLVLI